MSKGDHQTIEIENQQWSEWGVLLEGRLRDHPDTRFTASVEGDDFSRLEWVRVEGNPERREKAAWNAEEPDVVRCDSTAFVPVAEEVVLAVQAAWQQERQRSAREFEQEQAALLSREASQRNSPDPQALHRRPSLAERRAALQQGQDQGQER